MTMMTAIPVGKIDPVAALIGSVTTCLEPADIASLARFLVDCELADCCWEARQREVWIGEYQSLDEEIGTLDRIVILSAFGDRFHVGIALIDGDGRIHDLRYHRSFTSAWEAERTFEILQR